MGEAVVAGTMACRFCRATSLQTIDRQPPWSVARCRACGHYSTVPWPTDADLAAAYSADYYRDFGMWAGSAEERDTLMASTLGRVDLIGGLQQPPGRLVEIGTAMGPLVAAARTRGWDAFGYDTSTSAVDAGQRAYGDYVRLGDIHTAHAEQPPGDVLAAYHVLEHVPDPRAFLTLAHAMLREGGLLVLEVPHVRGFDARWLPAVRERVLDTPRHLTHYTPDTLSALVGEHGFSVLRVDGMSSRLVHRLRALVAREATGQTPAATPMGGRPGLLPRVVRRVLSGVSFCVYARRSPA